MKRSSIALIAVPVLLALAHTAKGQQQQDGVFATIQDPNGWPYSFATISATDNNLGGSYTATADQNGFFKMVLPVSAGSGTFKFTVSCPGIPWPLGFGAQTFSVNIALPLPPVGGSLDLGSQQSWKPTLSDPSNSPHIDLGVIKGGSPVVIDASAAKEFIPAVTITRSGRDITFDSGSIDGDLPYQKLTTADKDGSYEVVVEIAANADKRLGAIGRAFLKWGASRAEYPSATTMDLSGPGKNYTWRTEVHLKAGETLTLGVATGNGVPNYINAPGYSVKAHLSPQ
jgi:hypothetical protein